ncbi:protein phosphatase 1 regulatory subunit 12A-like isoform X2 [Xenia sp. Carnegie-2017]|uniref:protein phosphatase 1 regulatory subunit 12A-like isoform X2 n=1 Tax=Xenia sp. Carnegie-2017 TaxID=2897299 RepID=UPI001F0479CA|nr:protein phosphatase 1 regulatory subunit 12A-like isoform X2 [Xenia sp. Carnegie-2017]
MEKLGDNVPNNENSSDDFIPTNSSSVDSTAEVEIDDVKNCFDCKRTFKSCTCKSCAKCGAVFLRYWGTPIVKGRSHCRICGAAVCITCHVLIYDTFKICTRCHIKLKEEELSTQMALSAIAKGNSNDYFTINTFGITDTNLNNKEKRNEILINASKKGDHHVLSTLISTGADVNYVDNHGNTSLFYAASRAYLPCVALLIEKGADCTLTNKHGWTPLHFLALSNGKDESVLECADLLIQMGTQVFALTEHGETAGDIAEQNEENRLLLKILRAAEVEEAVQVLSSKTTLADLGKDLKIWKYLKTLLNVVTAVQGSRKDDSAITSKSTEDLHSNPTILAQKTKSFARIFSYSKPSQEVCKMCSTSKRDPLEPVINNHHIMESSNTIKDELEKCQKERDELEIQCKKLMKSIGTAVHEREKQKEKIVCLETKLNNFLKEKEMAIQRCEAMFENKLTKIKHEAEFDRNESNKRIKKLEEDYEDLYHLQSVYKLTWIPDKIVSLCMNSKCRAPFTKTRRRHHCRCCGRIFCTNCASQLLPIEALGYVNPVRICNQCFALLDETFVEVNYPDDVMIN